MASAGRILILPKGNYDAETEYEMLDLVKHNGTSWLAKKISVGIEPSEANNDYWMDLFDNNKLAALESEIDSLKTRISNLETRIAEAQTT